MFDERTNKEDTSNGMHQLAKMQDGKIVDFVYTEEVHQEMVNRSRMRYYRNIDAACVKGISTELRQIAIDTFGDKLDKLYLYEVDPGGSEDSDMSFLIVLKVDHKVVWDEQKKLSANRSGLGLKYDVFESIDVTSSEYFNKYRYSNLDYKFAVEEGLLLYG